MYANGIIKGGEVNVHKVPGSLRSSGDVLQKGGGHPMQAVRSDYRGKRRLPPCQERSRSEKGQKVERENKPGSRTPQIGRKGTIFTKGPPKLKKGEGSIDSVRTRKEIPSPTWKKTQRKL